MATGKKQKSVHPDTYAFTGSNLVHSDLTGILEENTNTTKIRQIPMHLYVQIQTILDV